ncbi:MAG: hypothetical protein WCI27_03975 [Candidatus Omnitrophota bacterium]
MKIIHNLVYFFLSIALAQLLTGIFIPACIILSIYLRMKKGISLKEFWKHVPNIYVSMISSIYPLVFLGFPALRLMAKNAGKGSGGTAPFIIDTAKLQPGDVILTGKERTGAIQLANILSAGIEHCQWTHACIYIGDEKVIEAQANGKGVIQTNLRTFYLDQGYRLKVLRHKFLPVDKMSKVLAYCAQEKDKNASYDTWGVSFYVLAAMIPPMFSAWLDGDFAEKFFDVRDAYFCSELIADAFKAADCAVFGEKSWRVKPLDFAFNPVFHEVV